MELWVPWQAPALFADPISTLLYVTPYNLLAFLSNKAILAQLHHK
jgi:hypothetical protein